jgi:hypothetical protein
MVAIDGQPFLQAELEPVAASDSVASPIVEILMRDDRLDIGVVGVGRGVLVGQDVFVVEDVEALVLHRAHVEVGHGDDVEDVEIVFAPEHLLVPFHGALERVHRIGGARLLAVLDIDARSTLRPEA